jgi:DNA end-binding protein Ku
MRKEGELKMARQLIADMTAPWRPDAFADEFTEAIHALAAKRAGAGETQKVTSLEGAAPAEASNVVELTELLSAASRRASWRERPGSGGKRASAAPAKKAAAAKAPRRRSA